MAIARPQTRIDAIVVRRWIHQNLFSSLFNGALTVVTLAVLGYAIYFGAQFVFATADWSVIEANRRLLFVGRYPDDATWRVWPPLLWFAAVAGLSYGIWSRPGIRDLLFVAAAAAFLLGFVARGEGALLLATALALGAGALVAGVFLKRGALAGRARQTALVGWFALLPIGWLLLFELGAPPTSQIGGFLLNIVLAAMAMAVSIPIGILLALGRASRFRSLKYGCISIIEFVRAGPLLVWIFMAQFVLPDFLPGALDNLDLVIRVIVVLTIFTSAYIAEIVRGGLQSVPRGQVEAAEAVGLNAFTITFWIVLPQALRAVIPALVSQLISLWKDTSLVAIIGAFDLLRVAQATQSQPAFVGTPHEVLLFAALMFWLLAFTMSRLSKRLEVALGVGTR